MDIIIHLSEKIDKKILSDTLIKLGLTSLELTNSKWTDKLFYLKQFKPIFNEDGRISYSNLNIYEKSIIIASENLLFISYNMIWDYFDFIDGYHIVNLLLDYKVIDRDEVYTKSGDIRSRNKIHDIDISDIIKKIEYQGEEWDDNSIELALIKHFIKFVMDKYKKELSLSQKLQDNSMEQLKNLNSVLNDFEGKYKKQIKELENKIYIIKKEIEENAKLNEREIEAKRKEYDKKEEVINSILDILK
ncbi:hypothetical protein [Brachyspira aalborgi]|uniref:Uncharacterized protein n=1 Tax=Brachyspira aalborgi TaxID=29522 RepID=A0A5C8CDS0_9SPIR|nr:hypothetical protein [Brachyspira aalborgi]TXJ11078.1 hypothetical protein EPJ80_10640 [Brachyspira aalborgi]